MHCADDDFVALMILWSLVHLYSALLVSQFIYYLDSHLQLILYSCLVII